LEPRVLTQDDLLNLFERPGVVSTKTIARAIAQELKKAREDAAPELDKEELLRDLAKRLKVYAAFVLFASYGYDEACQFVNELLSDSASKLQGPPTIM